MLSSISRCQILSRIHLLWCAFSTTGFHCCLELAVSASSIYKMRTVCPFCLTAMKVRFLKNCISALVELWCSQTFGIYFVCLAKWIPHLFLLLITTFPLSRLSEYDVVVTTYSLLFREVPTSKDEWEVPAKDHDVEVRSHIIDTGLP